MIDECNSLSPVPQSSPESSPSKQRRLLATGAVVSNIISRTNYSPICAPYTDSLHASSLSKVLQGFWKVLYKNPLDDMTTMHVASCKSWQRYRSIPTVPRVVLFAKAENSSSAVQSMKFVWELSLHEHWKWRPKLFRASRGIGYSALSGRKHCASRQDWTPSWLRARCFTWTSSIISANIANCTRWSCLPFATLNTD